MCVGSPTAGAWSSFQRRPDDEFETDRRIYKHQPGRLTSGKSLLENKLAGPDWFDDVQSVLLREPPAPYAAVNSRDKRGGKSSTAVTIEPFPSS